jgi:hypothetical protein
MENIPNQDDFEYYVSLAQHDLKGIYPISYNHDDT